MAKFSKGILGPISGKIGPVIGSSWKNIAYLKTADIKKKSNKGPSPAQQAHHKKFGFITRWLKPLHPYIVTGYRNLAKSNTEVNLAFSDIYHHAITGVYPDLIINYENVRISKGNLPGLDEVQAKLSSSNTLTLTWETSYEHGASFDDLLMLVILNDELSLADGFTGGIKRTAKTCSFSFNEVLVGHPFHAYVSMVSLDGRRVSYSQYLGKIEPISESGV
ncbi:MAG: hypothetical protein EOO90_21950 [Pedobacter sp.]|nr:MAG: hypothetical protein EOO90_21950 [Pedobacter sp.]